MSTAEKISVSVPKELVEEIRRIVPEGEVSRFIGEAVRYYLALSRQREAIEAAFGAWPAEDHPELVGPEDTSECVRELRARNRQQPAPIGERRRRGR